MQSFIQNPLVIGLIVSLIINLAMFLVAYWRQSDKLTDASYAVTFVVIAGFGFFISDRGWYRFILLALVTLWALRLGGFLLYRIVKVGKDSRFDEMRRSFWKFGKFWLAQAVSVWVILIPSTLAFDEKPHFTVLSLIGLAIWAVGFICESTADFQKQQFRNDPKNKGTWIESGIWRYSRHPNYFGEIVMWVGVYLYVLPSLSFAQATIGLVSPVFIFVLLAFVSGIPILEKSADKKWGDKAAYRAYKKRTSILLPLPRSR